MALHEIQFTIAPGDGFESIPIDWSHSGVVGSGDMEVLMRHADNGGGVRVRIITPVTGYDDVWERVLRKFVQDQRLGNVDIHVNDNNATPFVVATRLKQGLLEAKAGERE